MAVASAGTVARRCCVTTSQKRTVPSLPRRGQHARPCPAQPTGSLLPQDALQRHQANIQALNFCVLPFNSEKHEQLGRPVA